MTGIERIRRQVVTDVFNDSRYLCSSFIACQCVEAVGASHISPFARAEIVRRFGVTIVRYSDTLSTFYRTTIKPAIFNHFD